MFLQASKTKIRNQRGQALLEYVLLIFISLMILGGVIYQFNSAFRVFANSWFVGDESYVACAVKNGIVPDGSDDGEVCTRPKFDITKGQTKNGQGIDANGNPINQNKGSGKNSAGGGRGTAATSGGASRADSGRIGVIAFNSADAKNAGIKTTKGGKEADKSYTGSSGTRSSGPVQDFEGESSSNPFSSKKGKGQKKEDEYTAPQQAQNVPLSIRDLKTAREIAAEKNKKRAAQNESFDFSFGNIFKYIIIALLVFSIIFFLGSQVMAVARSKKRK